ncbi:MAG: T9SS type A sorting domain-containing protein [Saprospiraceae bacterium]|nr:T9SS type A sorting domain-containing protein [Saprospiraceae bacterium]
MKIHPIYLAFAVCLSICHKNVAQDCLPDGITLNSQAAINAFAANYPGCTHVLGDVKIVNSSASNLAGLAQIKTIGGDLDIFYSDNLVSLAGLDSLTSIGTNLQIGGNNGLTSLNGLNNLTSVGGTLQVSGNFALEDLDGMEGVTTIGQSLSISGTLLTSVDGLSSVTSIGKDFQIYSNEYLASISALASLETTVGNFILNTNPALSSLNGLENLVSVGGNFELSSLGSLTSFAGLENLSSVGGNFKIAGVPLPTSLAGFNDLSSVGQEFSVGGANLTSLDGLERLKTIGKHFYVSNNPNLNDLTALDSLVSIKGTIRVLSNDALTSLKGLDNIDPLGILDLYVTSSPNLSVCDVASICGYLADPTNSASISGNATGCNSIAQVKNECLTAVQPGRRALQSMSIFPNPTTGIVQFNEPLPKDAECSLTDFYGKTLKLEATPEGNFDISGLLAGVYCLRVWAGNGHWIQKIVKQ